MPPTTLNDLLDRAKIGDLVGAYANSIDRRDWAGYRSIFADRVDIDFFSWAGIRDTYDADIWVDTVRTTLEGFDATQHTLTNLAYTLDGDTATCVAGMTARHVLGAEVQILGGYYTDRFVRTAGGWQILGCMLTITWEEGDRVLFARAAARSSIPAPVASIEGP